MTALAKPLVAQKCVSRLSNAEDSACTEKKGGRAHRHPATDAAKVLVLQLEADREVTTDRIVAADKAS